MCKKDKIHIDKTERGESMETNKEAVTSSKVTEETYLDLFKRCVCDKGDATELDLKIFFYLIAKMQAKLKGIEKVGYYNGEEYYPADDYTEESSEKYTVTFNAKKLVASSTKSKMTNYELGKLLKRLMEITISSKDGNENWKSVVITDFQFEDFDKVKVHFNSRTIEHLKELHDNWIMLYSEELREMKGKFMLGLYYYYRKFQKTGKVVLKIKDAMEEKFNCKNYSRTEFVRCLNNAAKKMNERTNGNINLQIKAEKLDGNKTSHIVITFAKSK